MKTRVATVAEIIAVLPLKTEIAGRTIVLYPREGQPACKLVVNDQAKALDGASLASMSDPAIVQDISAWIEEDSVWVDMPAPELKAKAMAGFGLGSTIGAMPQPQRTSHLCPPQPWSGTYGEKLPVMQGTTSIHAHVAPQVQPTLAGKTPKQMKISSMFTSNVPLKVEPMDF